MKMKAAKGNKLACGPIEKRKNKRYLQLESPTSGKTPKSNYKAPAH